MKTLTLDQLSAILALETHALAAQSAQVPEMGLDDAGNPTPHWSATLDAIKAEWPCYFDAGRCTNELLVTCLSLSRCFGPTPFLDDETAKAVLDALWPEGNPCGLYLEWDQLAERLWDLMRVPVVKTRCVGNFGGIHGKADFWVTPAQKSDDSEVVAESVALPAIEADERLDAAVEAGELDQSARYGLHWFHVDGRLLGLMQQADGRATVEQELPE
jgi:hypothetical protein